MRRVRIVERDSSVRQMISRYATSKGYEVSEAEEAPEGFSLLFVEVDKIRRSVSLRKPFGVEELRSALRAG
ncbi:MAG: hypothetical protein HYY17_12120 [Planctomycetes bacterium]|nr:hypothetical protein [Planctomycetota bacterium]